MLVTSTNLVHTMDIPKKYTVRSGTKDSGREYEFKVTALMSLRCCGSDTTEMWIATNADDCGDFDDIILYRKLNESPDVMYLMQLKHQERGKSITTDQFKAAKGDFSIIKYSKGLADLKKRIDDVNDNKSEVLNFFRKVSGNLVFILFSNRNVQTGNQQNHGEFTSIFQEIQDEFFLSNLNAGGTMYKFNYEILDFSVPEHIKEFHENLYLFANQNGANEIDRLILEEIQNLLKMKQLELPEKTLETLVKNYIDFVTEWAKGKLGGHYPLTKTSIIDKLTDILLSRHINWKKFGTTEYDLGTTSLSKTDWKRITNDLSITVVDLDDQISLLLHEYVFSEVYSCCKELPGVKSWNERISKEAQSAFYQNNEELKHEALKIVGNFGTICLFDIYKSLWTTGKLPLLLETNSEKEYKDIINISKLSGCKSKIIIIVNTKHNLSKIDGCPKPFVCIQDLSNSRIKKVLRNKWKLQGKYLNFDLSNRIEKENYPHIKVRDIINILRGNFTIGNNFEQLPGHFIQRYVPKILISPDALVKLTDDCFLITCSMYKFIKFLQLQNLVLQKSRVQEYRPHQSGNIFKKGRIVIGEGPWKFRPIKRQNVTIHHLLLHEDEGLEWIKSTPTIKNIKEFKDNFKILKCYEIKDYFRKKVNLISADPGMGKSMFMDYLAVEIPDKWVLRINLNEHYDYYDNQEFICNRVDALRHLQYFNKQMMIKYGCDNTMNESVFVKYARAQNVVVLMDGFDEVAITHKQKVTQLAMILKTEAALWITTRPAMRSHLEEAFETFAFTLNPFDEEDQINFLSKFYQTTFVASDPDKKHNISEFVRNLLAMTKNNLNKWDNEFTGIPLQTRLLAEVFKSHCSNYILTKEFTITKHFDLLYLYEEFVKLKGQVFSEKFGQVYAKEFPITYGKFQKLYALKVLFAKEDLETLKVDEQLSNFTKTLNSALEVLQKDGIIVAEDEVNVNFVHRTFAEYLAAKWMYENCLKGDFKNSSKILIQKIFNPSYNVLRNIFDRMMLRNTKVHGAIINFQFETVKNILQSDPRAWKTLDGGGRSPLHIAAAWGVYHPGTEEMEENIVRFVKERYSSNGKDSMVDIVNSRMNESLLNQKDAILGFTPLDYAVSSNSLAVANALVAKMKKPSLGISDNFLSLCFYYGCSLNYLSLTKFVIKKFQTSQLKQYLNAVMFADKIPLQCAAANGSLEIINELLQSGADINFADNNGCTALHTATRENQTKAVCLLLSNGAKINNADDNGETVLHHSALNNSSLDVIKLLLSEGAEIGKENKCGETALHTASRHSRKEVLSLLLENEADIHKKDHKERTALHKAADNPNTDNLLLLLSKGANIDEQDLKGKTALHRAAKRNNLSVVIVLVDAGANFNICDYNGVNPLQSAKEFGCDDVADYLEKITSNT